MDSTRTLAACRPSSPLRALARRMENLGVEEDVRRIAAVLLETALDLDWAREPERVMVWLSQLALELAENRPPREIRLPR